MTPFFVVQEYTKLVAKINIHDCKSITTPVNTNPRFEEKTNNQPIDGHSYRNLQVVSSKWKNLGIKSVMQLVGDKDNPWAIIEAMP